jgi:hypothetical protein
MAEGEAEGKEGSYLKAWFHKYLREKGSIFDFFRMLIATNNPKGQS